MGRRNKKKRNNRQAKAPAPRPSPAAASKPAAPSPRVTKPTSPTTTGPQAEVAAAEQQATRAGLSPTPAAETPAVDLDELKRRLAGVVQAYTVATQGFDAREMAVLEAEESAETKKKALDQRASKLDEQQARTAEQKAAASQTFQEAKAERAALAPEREELDALRADLVSRAETVTAREVDADAGFIRRREEVLAELQAAHTDLLGKNAELAAELEEARQTHTTELHERERQHRERLEAAEAALETRRDELEAAAEATSEQLREREAAASKAGREALWAQEEADTLKADVREYIEARAQALKAEVEADLADERARREELRQRCSELESLLEQRRDAERALSHESPEEVQNRLARQQTRIRELEADLADRPSAAEAAELRDFRDAQSRWQDERRTLLRELSTARRQLETRNIDVDEVELLKDRNLALKENQRLLRAALDDLRSDIDERLDKHREQPVFPELMQMDTDPDLSEATPRFYNPRASEIDLESFAKDLQHRIGRDPDEERPDLYYRIEDVRAFLGGLAMSRLHLLQGISGIGKSSLPRRFAAAVGGHCETVSVQAGWRDRNDLLGYFNAFERRYYESGFVQALYKAQSPKYRDRVVVVLLDEMNLSHPEQYAADVLDVLERRDRSTRRFELMSARQKGDTPAAVQDGRYLPLPDNVWFVGTANHDETTKDFADKTYDRSFVLTLPGRPKPLKLRSVRPRPPVSFAMVMAAFDAAQQEHAKSAEAGLEWMESKLRRPMVDHFDVGWGGRLESQAKRFIPVVLAAGGTVGEALDQMICTRVLRKLQGRHDLMEEDVREVLRLLETAWVEPTPPAAATWLLRRELKRLGADV